MAGLKISITDIKIFTELLKMCARMVGDISVPEHYKYEMQGIIDEKENMDFERHPKIFYQCDKRACKHGCNHSGMYGCNLTSDIRHAENFELRRNGTFVEKGMEGLND